MTEIDLKSIERLRKARRYEEALSECDNLLKEESSSQIEILRTRARIFVGLDDYERATQDYLTIIDAGEGELKDYYLAANYALYAGKFGAAAAGFRELLRLGDEQNEIWFKSAAYFLLAYTLMELGQYREAIMSLDNAIAVEADVAMPVPLACGMWSHQQLREEIKRRETQGRAEQA